MTKMKRTEIIEEYDKDGKLIRRTTTEENEEDNAERTATPWYAQLSCLNCPYHSMNGALTSDRVNIQWKPVTTTAHC